MTVLLGAPEQRMPTPGSRNALRHRFAERGVDSLLLLVLPALLLTGSLFLYPFLYGASLSMQPVNGGRFANYSDFFGDSYQRATIMTTLRIAVPVALVNVLVSVPIAYRLRGRFRGKRLLTALLVFPVTLGTVLIAEGELTYLGPNGWLNRTLLSLHVVTHPLRLTHNTAGVVISLLISGFPFAFLLTLSYVSGIDPSLELAAATLGAGPRERFRTVLFPLMAPGLAVTFCLTFVLAFAVFPSASLVGQPDGSTRVISIAAYQAAFEKFDFSAASAIAMVMAGVQLAVVLVVLGVRRRFYSGPTSGGKG